MQKKLRITIDGKAYNVLVEDLTAPDYAAPQPMSRPVGVVAAPAAAVTPSVTTTAAVTPAKPAVAGSGEEISPLGGVVESIAVDVGQEIKAGDRIMVIESMKMKTPIHAQNGGTVKSITVKAGDTVEAGRVLATIG